MKTLDGLCNPYLTIAAVIAGGLLGVEAKEKLTLGDCEKDPGKLTDKERKELGISVMFPADLEEALKALSEDEEMVAALGEGLVKRYIDTKKAEIEYQGAMKEDERKIWLMERY